MRRAVLDLGFLRHRRGRANGAFLALMVMVLALAILGWILFRMSDQSDGTLDSQTELFVFCAAGVRPPIEAIADQYEAEFGVRPKLQYGGSNTLLSQITVGKTGDLYIAADQAYIDQAKERGLVQESISFARQRPIIAVQSGNPKKITSVADLFRDDVKVAIGNPDQTAVGRKARKLLKASGHWEQLNKAVVDRGVQKPTVPAVANAVQVGAIDAGIIWDATLLNHQSLEAVPVPELDAGAADIVVGVLNSTKQSQRALHFARYLAAPEKGGSTLKEKGFEVVAGDPWDNAPQLTFFCGAVNRAAIEPVIKDFEQREGVKVVTKYNGCGMLTGDMRTVRDQNTDRGFPDVYMACDVYYLDVVRDWFRNGVTISDTAVVLVTPRGNPKNIRTLEDLRKPGVRIAVGQPEQCTIGVLTRRLFKSTGFEEAILTNVVTEKASSAMLIPDAVQGTADAVLAYRSDTIAAAAQIEVFDIPSEIATAVQPFSIAKSSRRQQLATRFFESITRSRSSFEEAGFHWRLDQSEPRP